MGAATNHAYDLPHIIDAFVEENRKPKISSTRPLAWPLNLIQTIFRAIQKAYTAFIYRMDRISEIRMRMLENFDDHNRYREAWYHRELFHHSLIAFLEGIMQGKSKKMDHLRSFKTVQLWQELGRRLNVTYGKIQMAFHAGKPSRYAKVDSTIEIEEEEPKASSK